jgi:hypothetical protein
MRAFGALWLQGCNEVAWMEEDLSKNDWVAALFLGVPIMASILWGMGLVVSDWYNSSLRAQVRKLEDVGRIRKAALMRYADPKSWIGSEFVGCDDAAAPARIALREALDPVDEIAALPSRFRASEKEKS